MKTISAVINARLQSTRVPNKLMREFAGSSLIEIALEKLNKMDFFDNRFLAVAEQPLIDLSSRYPQVDVLTRDIGAVQKGINPLKVTFAHYLKVPTAYVFVFNPCLPCISIQTIKNAYDYFQSTAFNSYTAVVPTGDWIFDSNGNAVTHKDANNAATNKDVTFVKACHAFHIINVNYFRETGSLWKLEKDNPHLINVPESETVDVDTLYEFELAEHIYQRGCGKL